MPFPHFNMMSFWVTFVAFPCLVSSFFGQGPRSADGPMPRSAHWERLPARAKERVVLSAASIGIFSPTSALNFITTTLDMRTRA
jgi:heme/copper-type cytochrome/quinol oxidase subunit 1